MPISGDLVVIAIMTLSSLPTLTLLGISATGTGRVPV